MTAAYVIFPSPRSCCVTGRLVVDDDHLGTCDAGRPPRAPPGDPHARLDDGPDDRASRRVSCRPSRRHLHHPQPRSRISGSEPRPAAPSPWPTPLMVREPFHPQWASRQPAAQDDDGGVHDERAAAATSRGWLAGPGCCTGTCPLRRPGPHRRVSVHRRGRSPEPGPFRSRISPPMDQP